MYQFPSLRQRPARNAPLVSKKHESSFDFQWGLFSLITSVLVYLISMAGIAAMVYYKHSDKWTFVCYIAAAGWIVVMNITSNVIMMTSRRKVMRENRRTARQTSVNLDMLNDPENSRYLSFPPEIRSQPTNSQCDSTINTPPPPYEDLSQLSGETSSEAQGSGDRYVQLEALPESGISDRAHHREARDHENQDNRDDRDRENRDHHRENRDHHNHENREYRQENRELNQGRVSGRLNHHDELIRMCETASNAAKQLLLKKIEDRRKQLDRRLEGDSLRKLDALEYCMRAGQKQREIEKQSPEDLRQLSEPMVKTVGLTPKESLRQNLEAKYRSSADNLLRDVDGPYLSRNIERCELPRVHMKSTLSLRAPKTSTLAHESTDAKRLSKSGVSLQDVRVKTAPVDITSANEVGLPLHKTWKQKPIQVPDRALSSSNSDDSERHYCEGRNRRDDIQCSVSSSNLDESLSVRQSGESKNGRNGIQRDFSNLDKPFSSRQSGECKGEGDNGQCRVSSSNSDESFCGRPASEIRQGREGSQCVAPILNLDKEPSARRSGENRNGRQIIRLDITNSNLDNQFSVGQSRNGRESILSGASSSKADNQFPERQSSESRNGRQSSHFGSSILDKSFYVRKSTELRNGRESIQRDIPSSNADKLFSVGQSSESRNGVEIIQSGASSSKSDNPFPERQSSESRNGRKSSHFGIPSSNLDKSFYVIKSSESRNGRESIQSGISYSTKIRRERLFATSEYPVRKSN